MAGRPRAQGVSRAAGQGLIEYALVIALIAIVAIVVLLYLGNQISSILAHIGEQLCSSSHLCFSNR